MVEPHVLEHATASEECRYCGRETFAICSCGVPLCGADECKRKHDEENRIATLEVA